MAWKGLAMKSPGKSKTTSTLEKSYASIGQPYPVTATSKRSTGETSPQLTLSVEGSPVSRSVAPGSEQARTMTVTSGRKWCGALPSSSPLGSLVRMCLESSIWHSTKCVLTWKVSATPSGRSVYRLVPSMPRTNGNGSGLWPTPASNKLTLSGELHNKDGAPWDGIGKPHSSITGKPVTTALTDAVKMWPTPHASCSTGAGSQGRDGGENLQTKVGGSLNPQWVEWLMGYPDNWTKVDE